MRPSTRFLAVAIAWMQSLQVLGGIEGELKAGGNSRCTVRELPGLNHLFQTCNTGAFSEYVKIEETMSPLALQTISEWIRAETNRSGTTAP